MQGHGGLGGERGCGAVIVARGGQSYTGGEGRVLDGVLRRSAVSVWREGGGRRQGRVGTAITVGRSRLVRIVFIVAIIK